MPANDKDPNTNLTYTLVTAPSRGTLSGCLNGTADITCDYLPDTTSTGNVQFTYKANDGGLDSEEVFTVFLDIKVARSPIMQISLGGQHTCVLFKNKKVTCWGRNQRGQLGLNHTIPIGNFEVPLFRDYAHTGDQEFVNLGEGALQISSGESHTCALLESGSVRCWGYNHYGQLGLGNYNTIGDNELPSSINALNFGQRVIQVSAGQDYTCVLLENGGTRCWGHNYYGQLGLGHRSTVNSISQLNDLPLGQKVKLISAGPVHACAILFDGKVKCWGNNNSGQLGLGHSRYIGDTETLSNLPAVSLSAQVLNLSLGIFSTCAVLANNGRTCWGSNHGRDLRFNYNIGDNETPFSFGPLDLGESAASVSSFASADASCVLLDSGSVKCWGANNYGQLGLGDSTITHRHIASDSETISFGRTAVAISSRGGSSCVILDNGEIQCWGKNDYGQLGLGHVQTIGDDEDPTERTMIEGSGLDIIARFKVDHLLHYTNQSISFNASHTYSASTISTYSWDFGDGSDAQTGEAVIHTFTAAGAYEVTLTVTNSDFQTHSVSRKLTILSEETTDEDDVEL